MAGGGRTTHCATHGSARSGDADSGCAWRTSGREEDVTVLGVTPDGSLRVRLANGTERVTSTGESIL